MISLKWLPNAISLSRAVISPLIPCAALDGDWTAAFVLLNIGIVSDWLDGWLAEFLDAKSWIGGKIFEPGADLALTVATLAGALLTKAIPWWILWILIPVFIADWAVIILTKHPSKLHALCSAFAPFYYISVLLSLAALYAYKAYSVEAAWLLVGYIPLGCIAVYVKRNRIRHFLQGNC